MNGSFLNKVIALICLACINTAASVPVFAGPAPKDNAVNNDASRTSQIQFAPIIVNGRTLTGPNTAAHRRDGRILIPVLPVARALGDTLGVDAVARTVTVQRQTGQAAVFDVRLGQVRENGASVLMVSNAGEIVFSPNAGELLLPVEIAAALFEVSIRYDDAQNAVIVTRGHARTEQAQSKSDRSPVEIHQIDYEYNLNRYSSGSSQSLAVMATGRLADGRFNFSANSSAISKRISLQQATFSLERPNGQRYTAGDFGTGADLQFLSANIRGGSAIVPAGDILVTAFAGRAYSGVILPFTDTLTESEEPILVRDRFRYDTNVFGFFATTNTSAVNRRVNPATFSAGAMRFSGSRRSGDLVSGSVNYDVSRLSVQGDVAFGKFTGFRADNSRFSGYGAAADIAGTFQVSESLALQARYVRIGENFLSPQSGWREPVDLKAAGVTWSPKKWLSTSFNASVSRRPGDSTQNNKFATAAFSITPGSGLPRFFISHTQSSTSQSRSAAFTLLNASKEFSRLRLFLSATRIKSLGPASTNAQIGASYAVNDSNALELSQGVGSQRSLNGQFDWRTSNLFNHRLSLSAGVGYNYGKTSKFSTYERLTASLSLPRQTSLQINYFHTNAGPTLLVSLRGSLFRRREASGFLDSAVSEMNSYGKVSGRVYQDVNQNGRFDPGVDQPQADVKVRVDGNRYVVSDENGLYGFDSIIAGDHKVYLDLLSVRADLTLLGDAALTSTLVAGRDSVFDFRLVRTGRFSGRVWLDANENGKFDENEKPLADIRVVLASGRDTLTDSDGNFTIGDLPPGEHVVLIDEKTLPEKTTAGSRPLAVQVFAGRETSDVRLAVIMIPAEVVNFGQGQANKIPKN